MASVKKKVGVSKLDVVNSDLYTCGQPGIQKSMYFLYHNTNTLGYML